MKKFLAAVIPKPVLKAILGSRAGRRLRVFRDFWADYRHYARWSGTLDECNTKQTLQAYIIRYYHAVEVGLAYPNTRTGYGQQVVGDLLAHLETYTRDFGWDRHARVACNVLGKYVQFHQSQEIELPDIASRLEKLEKGMPSDLEALTEGGKLRKSRGEIFPRAFDFEGFVATRHSFREYMPAPVEQEVLERAVRMAMRSPSACNRQQAKVYVLDDREIRDRVLEIQNNKRGWRDQPDRILLVTANVELYAGGRERHAAYIDGSLFAMTLVWALHSLHVGTCCLNLNLTPAGDRQLRAAAKLQASEVPIMLIAAGRLPDAISVPVSSRRSTAEVLEIR